jgi:HK97 family phage prohead protease
MSDKFAYSLMELKALDDDKRILTGVASTPVPDLCDDIVEPEGAEFKLPLPFLWQHWRDSPIGHVTAAKVSKTGIAVTIQLVKVDEPQTLKDKLDEAWQYLKTGLVRGLSIGFIPQESANIEGSWGRRHLRWRWTELSAVTIACNPDAMVTSMKSLNGARPSREVIDAIRSSHNPRGSGIKLLDPRQRGVKLLSK